MRDKAYRYHQNKTHNDQYPKDKHHRDGRQYMTNNRTSWGRYNKPITWSHSDSKQMEDLKQQIENLS